MRTASRPCPPLPSPLPSPLPRPMPGPMLARARCAAATPWTSGPRRRRRPRWRRRRGGGAGGGGGGGVVRWLGLGLGAPRDGCGGGLLAAADAARAVQVRRERGAAARWKRPLGRRRTSLPPSSHLPASSGSGGLRGAQGGLREEGSGRAGRAEGGARRTTRRRRPWCSERYREAGAAGASLGREESSLGGPGCPPLPSTPHPRPSPCLSPGAGHRRA